MPETPEEIQKRLAAENAKMREAIFEAGQAWASLENHMALVLTAVLNIVREQHSNASLAIYFAPSNSETRFAIVDAAFTCLSFPPVETHDRVMACWARFMSKAHSARGVRNKIVHGEVQNLPSPTSGRPQVRLTGQIFDLKRNEFVAAYASKQLPGMSRNDVKQNADKLWTANQVLRGVRGPYRRSTGARSHIARNTCSARGPSADCGHSESRPEFLNTSTPAKTIWGVTRTPACRFSGNTPGILQSMKMRLLDI